MNKIDLVSLRKILEKCWPKNKSKGQCYITALVVQDFFGGQIVRWKGPDGLGSHYWNILPDGKQVDLTSDQYGGDGFDPIYYIGIPVTRIEKLYLYPQTASRFARLLKKVSRELKNMGM